MKKLPEPSIIDEAMALEQVQLALRQVKKDLKSKDREVVKLKASSKKLRSRLDEAKDLLKETKQTLKVKEFALAESEDRAEETFCTVAAEEAGLEQLKAEQLNIRDRIAFLQKHNTELTKKEKTAQSNKEETDGKFQELNEKLEDLNAERQQHKLAFQQAQTNLQIEMDAFEMEREQWKDRSLLMLRKLEHENQQLASNNKKSSELQQAIDRINDQILGLDNTVQEQEDELATVVELYAQNKTTLEGLRERHKSLGEANQDGDALHSEAEQKLERSSEQLRVMAEKVFLLLKQLEDMDKWKAAFEEKEAGTLKKSENFRRKIKSCETEIHDLANENEKIEAMNEQLSAKLLEQRKEEYAYRREYLRLDKTKTVLKKKIKMKNNALAQMTNKHISVAEKLTKEQSERKREKDALANLTDKVDTMEHSTQALKTKLTMLELAKARLESQLSKTQEQLQGYVEKESYFQQLEDTLKAKRKATDKAHRVSRAIRSETAEGFPYDAHQRLEADRDMIATEEANDDKCRHHGTRRGQQLRVRKMTRGSKGKLVQGMMKDLRISEEMLLDWLEDPNAYIRSLDVLFDRLKLAKKNSLQAKKLAAQSVERQKGMCGKNRELFNSLETSEKHKSGALQKMMSIVQALSVSGDLSSIESLDLSDSGLEDREVALLANALKENQVVNKLILNNNRISAHGLLAIAERCLDTASPILCVELQQNRITLDGLEALAFLISECANNNSISASLSKDDHGALLPIVQVTSAEKTLNLDLRFNRLQQTNAIEEEGEEAEDMGDKMKRALARITQVLSACGSGEGGDETQDWEGARVLKGWRESQKQNSRGGVRAGAWGELSGGTVYSGDDLPEDEDEDEPGHHPDEINTERINIHTTRTNGKNTSRSGKSAISLTGLHSTGPFGYTRDLSEEMKIEKFKWEKEQRNREEQTAKRKAKRTKQQSMKRSERQRQTRLASRDKPAKSALSLAGPGGLPSLRGSPSRKKNRMRAKAGKWTAAPASSTLSSSTWDDEVNAEELYAESY